MTTTAADAVIAGRDAWQRLCRRDRASWNDWLAVGHALLIGRAACMQIAKANKPVGSRYNAAMGNWLRENGLDGITNQERYRALLCLENLEAIEVWHASLDDAQRRRLNHPGAIWAHWQRP